MGRGGGGGGAQEEWGVGCVERERGREKMQCLIPETPI